MNELMIHNIQKKLNEEQNKITGNKEKAMAEAVKKALIDFSKQDSEFAQAIMEHSGSFAECMNAVAKNVGNHISDIEAYRRAVKYYFTGADISFSMTVNLCASLEGTSAAGAMSFSLEDLLEV